MSKVGPSDRYSSICELFTVRFPKQENKSTINYILDQTKMAVYCLKHIDSTASIWDGLGQDVLLVFRRIMEARMKLDFHY